MTKFAAQLLAFVLLCGTSHAFTPLLPWRAALGARALSAQASSTRSVLRLADEDATIDTNGTEELTDERKANLFQFLLRDLQVEGVPLLAVDVDQANTLQVAMWTTLAELCDQPDADKACLVFEDISVDTLSTFVNDFETIKNKERIMTAVPELERVSVSLVGQGIGPAILMDVAEAKPEDISTVEVDTPEPQLSAAMKAFYGRMVDKTDAYPYKNDRTPTSFKACRRSDVPHILSYFWNSVCELEATDEENLGTTVMMIPGIHNQERFSVISELLSRSLCLYQGDDDFVLAHFFPDYDRSKIHPTDELALGHIPPLGWLRPMIRSNDDDETADQLSDEELALSNYQRRSPMASVVIKRVSLMDTESRSAVELTLQNGETVSAGAIRPYAENAKFLATEGEASLAEAQANEKSMLE